MIVLAILSLLTASRSEIPADIWACSNDLEVWCTVDSCAAKLPEETTPMSITAARNGAIQACAYTGCWEGAATVSENMGRIVWAANDLPFSSRPEGGFEADISLLIVEEDGVGFIRVGGIASPVLCVRKEPGQ
ncbi:MAG: hypothetical protein AAGB02_03945 [Pseudomonadota bacterium]